MPSPHWKLDASSLAALLHISLVTLFFPPTPTSPDNTVSTDPDLLFPSIPAFPTRHEMRGILEGKLGRGFGTHLHSCKDQTQDGAARKLPRDLLQPSLLALKRQGAFHHIRKTVSLVCFETCLGKPAPLLILLRHQPSGGIWRLMSVPEDVYLVGSLITAG